MLRVSRFLIAMLIVSACSAPETLTEEKNMGSQSTQFGIELPIEGDMPSLDGATGWLNSKPLTSTELRGKVVLVDFWTFTCINWLRTQPYVRAWSEKYKEHGLVVIGVHTPEFAFEKDVENVRRAAQDLDVDYPIAIDSEYAIWAAFRNRYWPAFYFVDAEGRIRHHQFGEGDYERSERMIQRLLVEAGNDNVPTDLVQPKGDGVEKAADWNNLGSPETYVGYGRTANFRSPAGIVSGEPAPYTLPIQLSLNEWALSGDWRIEQSAAIALKANSRIAYRFRARDLHLVMRPAPDALVIRFRISIDGQPPGKSHGVHTDVDGNGTLSDPRMYQLYRESGPVVERHFEIEFIDAGAEVYVFTFG